MIKKLMVVSILLASKLNAQSTLDSMIINLNKYVTEDTVRIGKINSLSFAFANRNDYKNGMLYADSAIALSIKLKSPQKLAASYFAKGSNLLRSEEYSLALRYLDSAVGICKQYKLEIEAAKAIRAKGLCHYYLSQYFEAKQCYESVLDVFKKNNLLKYEAYTLNSLGVVTMDLSDHPQALKYYYHALDIFEKLQDTAEQAQSLNNIGIVFERMHNHQKAEEYYNKALALNKANGNEIGIASCYNGLANLYDATGSHAKALLFYMRAMEINKAKGQKFGLASNLFNIGIVYYKTNQYTLALQHFNNALPLFNELGDRDNYAFAKHQIGLIIAQAPDSILLKNNIKPSLRIKAVIQYQTHALEIFNELGDVAGSADAYEALSEAYLKQKDFEKSLSAYKQFILLRDSVIGDEKKSEITKREMQYDFDKKELLSKAAHEKEIASATAEISKQKVIKNSAMAGGTAILIAGACSFLFYKRRRDAEKQKSDSDFKAQVSDTEMKALRAQMNPHFIFNSLNSIADSIHKHDSNTASLFTTRFAKLMRLILENSEKKEVALIDDLKALELYMQLESMRMYNKFSYHIQVDDAIDKEATLIPPLLIQPFVENSIWHGIAQKEGAGKITIVIKQEDGMIKCIIEDNGVGRKKAAMLQSVKTPEEKKSLGMKITKARIEIINKLKKSKAGVELFDLAEGVRVELKLPLELSF